MVTKKNLVDIVRILMEHVTSSEGNFRTTLVDKIIEVRSLTYSVRNILRIARSAVCRHEIVRSIC
jgi:hypothetical protein